MNYIQCGSIAFHGDSAHLGTDGLLMSGNAEQFIALFGNELVADSLTFVVNSKSLKWNGTEWLLLVDIILRKLQDEDGQNLAIRNAYPDYRALVSGTPLELYNYKDGVVIGRFYIEEVTQISRKSVKITCTDGVGMLTNMGDYGGGIWSLLDNKTAGSIIAEIFSGSGVEYRVTDEVADVKISGRLPRENRRTSLAKLLTATGATLVEKEGVIVIKYLGNETPAIYPNDVVYLNDGGVTYLHPATEVQVVEHSFYNLASDEQVTLFDNSDEAVTADHELVIFKNPVHDLTTTGSVTINESNANYAIVSGVGTLEGKEYTHVERVTSKSTGVTAAHNVVVLDNNELVGAYNIANVAQRLVNYYKLQMAFSYYQYDTTGSILAGTPLTIEDPFGIQRTGWISKKTFDLGNKTKARMDVLVDFVAGPYGSSYNAYQVFRATDIVAGRLTLPAEMVGSQGMVMLIGGAGGGQAGYDGEAGEAPQGLVNYQNHAVGVGGAGGAEGACGERPHVLTFQVENLPSYYDGASVGVGGAGGVSNGALGSAGGATTLGGLSSADGIVPLDDVVNLLDSTVYCSLNSAGYAGGDGGNGSGKGSGENPDIYYPYGVDTSTNGGDVITPDGTWVGGTYLNGLSFRQRVSSGNRVYDTGSVGGGGAAYGADGSVGYVGDEATYDWQVVGGNGANATAPTKATETQAGRGGNGGGGGGGAAQGSVNYSWSSSYTYGGNTGGTGGLGSAGGQGGDGLIVIYYNA